MRKMKKILSVLALTLAVTMMMSTAVFAEEITPSEDYIVTYSAEEITDVDELIALALEPKASQPATFSTEQEEETALNGKQLIEVRVYADGIIEKSYLGYQLQAVDDNFQPMAITSFTHSGSDSGYGATVLNKTYYSVRYSETSLSPLEARIDKIVATISHSAVVFPSSVNILYIKRNPTNSYEEKNYSCSTSTHQTFTMVPTDKSFFQNCNPYNSLTSQVTLYLQNGSYLVAFAWAQEIVIDY